MFHIIYRTTNTLNNKIYIGAHSTSNIEDDYLGSGKYLKRAIKLHGRDNFKRDVLFVFNTKEEMFSKERELVSEEFITTNNTYNLKIGGSGGNPGLVGAFNGHKHTEETKRKIALAASNQICSEETRKKLSENNGMKHNLAGRAKMIESLRGRTQTQQHRANVAQAQTGMKMINNGSKNTFVKKEKLHEYLSLGWKLGKLIHR